MELKLSLTMNRNVTMLYCPSDNKKLRSYRLFGLRCRPPTPLKLWKFRNFNENLEEQYDSIVSTLDQLFNDTSHAFYFQAKQLGIESCESHSECWFVSSLICPEVEHSNEWHESVHADEGSHGRRRVHRSPAAHRSRPAHSSRRAARPRR